MAENHNVIVELGSVIQDRGEWDDLASNARLYMNNIVQYGRNAYRVKAVPVAGYLTKDVLPTNTTYYTLFAGVGELATDEDFTNPDATKRAKIPTVGAVLDGLNDGVYDVTARNNGATFESLEALLSDANLNTLIPASWRKGGMSIKFIQGTVQTNDHKYVQYRLMAQTFSTDEADWQGVDTEIKANSKNLAESGAVKAAIEANNVVEGKAFFVTDGGGNVIAKIDKDGVHSVDFKIGANAISVSSALGNVATQISEAVNAEEERAKAVEATKLDVTLSDSAFYFTDPNGYVIAKIDANGVHSVNIDEEPNKIKNDNIVVTDNNGYIIAKVDRNGVHSAKDKHAVACMVLSESYYPTAASTRDGDGNVTYAEVMFETGVAGSISITYTNGNSSSVAVVYGNYNYTITINRDSDGNVETVNVQ